VVRAASYGSSALTTTIAVDGRWFTGFADGFGARFRGCPARPGILQEYCYISSGKGWWEVLWIFIFYLQYDRMYDSL
jgi:hypothetical protein